MNRPDLATKLVAAKTTGERKRILTSHPRLADAGLAHCIKDICYESWAAEPSRARQAGRAARALENFAAEPEISAVARWIDGIAKITTGKFNDAIQLLDEADRMFRRLGRKHDSSQTKVAKLMALGLMGEYEAAIKTGRQALRDFLAIKDDFGAGRVELNLANLYSRREQHRESEKYGLSARDRFAKTGSTKWKVMAENGLAITYSHLNDLQRAKSFYLDALTTARASQSLVTEAEIEASLGELSVMTGDYAEAVRFLESSRQKYLAIDVRHNTSVADLEIGASYLKLNLIPEASDVFRRTLPALRRMKLRPEEARARVLSGRAAALLGQNLIARREFELAASLCTQLGNNIGVGLVRLEQAHLELRQNNRDTADRLLCEAEQMLRGSDNPRHKALSGWIRAEVIAQQGKQLEARRRLVRLLEKGIRLHFPEIILATLNSLGEIDLSNGHLEQAENHFKKAIGQIEELGAALVSDEFRVAFQALYLRPFEALVELLLSQNRFEEAFAVTERSRAQALSGAMRGEVNVQDGSVPAKLMERADTLRKELNWAYSRSLRASGGELVRLQRRTAALEKALATATRRVDSYNTLKVSSRTAGVSMDIVDFRAECGRTRTAIVEFIKTGDSFSAFVLSATGLSFVADIATEQDVIRSLTELNFQFSAFRYGTKLPENMRDRLSKKTDDLLTTLYDMLLGRVQIPPNARELIVVPAGALNHVPFHALRNSGSYIIERREVGYAPSASIWRELRSRRRQKIQRSFVVGYADAAIPFVEAELQAVAERVPRPEILNGERATFAAFMAEVKRFDLVHIACHGQFRHDNPMYSSVRLADGWVTANDLIKQHLKAGLVTLSACETGMSKIAGSEEIMGLARGFLSAGARSLVLSLWTVNDEATRVIMTKFYDHLRSKSPGSALSAAQREMIAAGRHPYFWAPFIKIGK